MIVGARRPGTGTMPAARHEQWGSPLGIVDVPRPEPAAGEVRIAVEATSVNPIDMYTGRNAGYEQSMRLPFVPGWDVAGVVDAVGYGVTRFEVGDRVFGLAWFPYPAGTYAQYTAVPAYQLVPLPASVPFVEAACLPMAALTAWQMLDAAGVGSGSGVDSGCRVLISGASGGVGHLAVQIAVARGATVVALARPHDHAALYELGARSCVDYTDRPAVAAIGTVDAALDLVGGDFGGSLFDLVAAGGTVALATAWSIPQYRAAAEARGIRAVACLVEPDPVALTAIAGLVDTGRIRIVVGARFDLYRAVEAQAWVTNRLGFGKAAIVVGDREGQRERGGQAGTRGGSA
ncbi:NADP-dependent oxidoreductase [Rhodococcus pyridinivorans]|uniref:NADP-dependent oxidoreductase n=1 Tax=Rhodococcus pyridinivorans TaxID=103816 RepID=A0A7M2XGN6_9NOCA|nr:NADP-dependent oxidoreductase [Rhodococcus pyridinivorans]QOV96934.1 NADP-dependent oxidoreductase [Rhodococcus pyridinivorans]WMM70898.1 NADP-dependent oxidoreductase [Rhodococcus pyridinivorans]